MASGGSKNRAEGATEDWNNLDVSASTGLFELSPSKSFHETDMSSLYFPENELAEKLGSRQSFSSLDSTNSDLGNEHSRVLSEDIAELEGERRSIPKKKTTRRKSMGTPANGDPPVQPNTRRANSQSDSSVSRISEECSSSETMDEASVVSDRGSMPSGRGARGVRKSARRPTLAAVQEEPEAPPTQAARNTGRRRKAKTSEPAPAPATERQQPSEPAPAPAPEQEEPPPPVAKPKVRRVKTLPAPQKKTPELAPVDTPPDRRRTFVINIEVNLKNVDSKDGANAVNTAIVEEERPLELDTSVPPISIIEERITELSTVAEQPTVVEPPTVAEVKREPDSVQRPRNSQLEKTFVKSEAKHNSKNRSLSSSFGKMKRKSARSNRSHRCSPSTTESSEDSSESSCDCSDCCSSSDESCSCSDCCASCSCSSCESGSSNSSQSSGSSGSCRRRNTKSYKKYK